MARRRLLIESLEPGDLGQTRAEAKKAKEFVQRLVEASMMRG